MKRFRFVLLVILLLACCIAVLGCSGKEALVGVYQRQSSGNTNSAGNRIILYKDGACSYLGTDNAKWSYQGDVVTVTTWEADSYYVDVYFDPAMADHEFLSLPYYRVMFACAGFDIVSDAAIETKKEDRIIRIRTETLLKEVEHKMLFETLRMIQDVKTVASCTEKGNSWDYKLTVVDNCLVADSYPLDTVYVKVGE